MPWRPSTRPPTRRPGRSRVRWVEGWPKRLSSAGHATRPSRSALRVWCEKRQVSTQSLLPRLVGRFCAVAQPSHSHTPPPTGHQPPQTHGPTGSGLATMGKLGISRLAVLGLPRRISIPRRLLGTVHLHGSRLKRRQRRPLLGRLLQQHPWEPPPRLFQLDPGGWTPQPQVPPRRHVLHLPELPLL